MNTDKKPFRPHIRPRTHKTSAKSSTALSGFKKDQKYRYYGQTVTVSAIGKENVVVRLNGKSFAVHPSLLTDNI